MVAGKLQSRRRLLWAAAAVLVALAAGTAWVLERAPLRAADVAAAPDGHGPADAGSPPDRIDPLDEYAAVYARKLRKPLFDPRPVVEAAPPEPKPELRLTLTGTAVEPGFTFATFRTDSGEDKLVRIGQTVGGAKVVEIAPGSATVEFHGDRITLTVSDEGASG